MLEVETEQLANEVRRILAGSYNLSPAINGIMDAVVLAEDRRYWRHTGFDPKGAARAAWCYIRTGRISGASTIEQQLVRTLRGRYELTLNRKLTEIVIAIKLTKRFSKGELLRAYLEIAYFGWSANGLVQLASRLDIDLHVPDVEASALIASLLKLPMPKNPSQEYRKRLKRRMDFVRSKIGRANEHGRTEQASMD